MKLWYADTHRYFFFPKALVNKGVLNKTKVGIFSGPEVSGSS